MIGSLIEIIRSNRFKDFDLYIMLNALLYSQVFTLDDFCTLNTVTLTYEMTTSLSIGFPKGYLV